MAEVFGGRLLIYRGGGGGRSPDNGTMKIVQLLRSIRHAHQVAGGRLTVRSDTRAGAMKKSS